jgi:hypothetical protein
LHEWEGRNKTGIKEGFKMKKILSVSLFLLMVVILAQCATMPQRWPAYERRAEDKMMALQARIGDGLKTGVLTPNQAQIFLARLEEIRRDYNLLRERVSTREEWERLLMRLDTLENEVNRSLTYPPRIDETRIEDRIIALQRRIDEARISGRLPRPEGREFQVRLDAIRSDFLRMVRDRVFTPRESEEILHRLDLLERDLDRF